MPLKAAVNLFFERDTARDTQRDKPRDTSKERDKPRDKPDSGGFPAPSPRGAESMRAPTSGSKEWDAETAAAIEWFLTSTPPAEPFEMQRGVTIAHPCRYWTYLRESIAAGPGVGRAYYGALQNDLCLLHELFGPEPDGDVAALDDEFDESVAESPVAPATLGDEFGPA